jgi:DNA primase
LEEITKKEIHNALRSRISAEQAKFEVSKDEADTTNGARKPIFTQNKLEQVSGQRSDNNSQSPMQTQSHQPMQQQNQQQQSMRPQIRLPIPQKFVRKIELTGDEKKVFSEMLENLIGTRGAQVLDSKLNILGKVPITELDTTLKSLGKNMYAVVFDGVIERELVRTAERLDIKYLVGMDSKVKPNETKVGIFTVNQM